MKKVTITVLISNGKTIEKVVKNGFDRDTISSTFEFIGILEGLKFREMQKLKEWVRIEKKSDDNEGI